jgi:hypothetical protein
MLNLKRITSFRSIKQIWILGLLLLTAFLFFTNTFHEEYQDEYDNIVGGKYILEGRMPYRDWFSHHHPGTYYWSAILLVFSSGSFVWFRIFLSISYVALYLFSYLYIKVRFKDKIVDLILIPFMLFAGCIGTYFWLHMMLGDTLAAHLMMPAFSFLVILTLLNKKMSLKDYAFVTVFTFLSLFSSMTYCYVIMLINLYAFYRLFHDQRSIKTAIIAIVIALAPYLFYVSYLVLSGSIDDYLFSNVTYNNYYVYNYPHEPGSPVNPLRYAIVILQNYANNTYPLLTQVKDLVLNDPFAVTFLLSYVAFVMYLVRVKQYVFAAVVLGCIVFSTARIDPRMLGEKNYQASVYILLSSLSGMAALYSITKHLNETKMQNVEKIVTGMLFVLLSLYWIFSGLFAPLKMSQKFYEKYMGIAPLIYDRPEIAQYVNAIVDEGEYTWIGPLEFKELFFLDRDVASKYHWFLQHAIKLPRYHEGLIDDFEKNKPVLVVFKCNFAPWGGDPSEFNYFLANYLDTYYIRLYELNEQSSDKKYRWKISNTLNFDIDGQFYIRKDKLNVVIPKLIKSGYVEEVPIS